MTAPPLLLDPDDLLTMPDGDLYELIDGIPVEKDMGAQSEAVAYDLGLMLYNFVRMHRLGRCFGSNTGYACFPNHPKMYRKPDSSFIARGRLPDEQVPVGLLKIAPDLIIEVVSPTNSFEEIEDKIDLFRSAGTRLIWVVSPKTRSIYVHRPQGPIDIVPPDGTLTGEDVIPGFTCRIAELFE